MAIHSISLSSKTSLRPVTELELKRSVYESVSSLDILYQRVIGSALGTEALCTEVQWQGTPEQHHVAENSLMWDSIKPLWIYAERGLLNDMLHLKSDNTSDLVSWIRATQGLSLNKRIDLSETSLKVISKFFARLKLDYEVDLDLGCHIPLPIFAKGVEPIQNRWLPQVHQKHLTLVELGLLAGVSNLRTIRNAQYGQDDPLQFMKRDKQILIETQEARRWLKRRRGFVPSPPCHEVVEA